MCQSVLPDRCDGHHVAHVTNMCMFFCMYTFVPGLWYELHAAVLLCMRHAMYQV